MKKILSAILILAAALQTAFPQDLPEAYRAYREKFPEGPPLNHQDSLFLLNLPKKELPASLRADPLPPVVDNSSLPYLRPVFMQEGASCGQAALVGYNFTYEMDYSRNLHANTEENQYPTHFTWNFQNGGNGWYGVSYFHSIEILRQCGCMNSADYGGYFDDGKRWINGYDAYYNGMFNRVKGFYSIYTGSAEGILALKHWLYDHMGEGTFGGVASYYANTPWNAAILNDTTSEGGKHVVFAWYPMATHAMTIVGYNDSIRWDYNSDGMYTNDIDINFDGVVDPRDWEISAVKFVNSHGLDQQDSGFCYMMYKCLAETFEQGGVWNRSVHILDINEDYQPLVTYKIVLKHDKRQKIKVMAGVSGDTTDAYPAWIMDFPIINYQGWDHYMQGNDTAEFLKSLEFGLDVTPLLSHIQSGSPAKFFFMVDEDDPLSEGEGQITSFSLLDYTSGGQEIISGETPLPIENNSRTLVSVVHNLDFDFVRVTTETLPPYSIGEPYAFQMQASGGTSPYSWEPVFKYRFEQSEDTLPLVNEMQVLFTSTEDTIVPVALGFTFPFYGREFDTVYMHINGHLQFDDSQLPWPYMQEPDLQFRKNRLIAPMTNMAFTITQSDEDGGWVEQDDSTATFRWKLSSLTNPGSTDMNFAARLHRNGDIDFIYGIINLEENKWTGGISEGNNADYLECPGYGTDHSPSGMKFTFLYNPLPGNLQLSLSGSLDGQMENDGKIYDLDFRVTDHLGFTDTRSLQFTSGPYLFITANGGEQVDYGDTVGLDLRIINGSTDTLRNCNVSLGSVDPFIFLSTAQCNPGTLAPGQELNVPGAFQCIVDPEVPDHRDLLLQADLSAADRNWQKDLVLMTNAPALKIKDYEIDDNDNGKLDPGETAPLLITLQNTGHASIDIVSNELFSLEPQVEVIQFPGQPYGIVGKGASETRQFSLHAQSWAPEGFTAHLVLTTLSSMGLTWNDTINIRIGRMPVLVIDMDPNRHSGPYIKSMLEELDVYSEYEYTISSNIYDYQSLFVSLGYHNSNHMLTLGEGTLLANYLDQGGRVYLEGKKTWKEDPGTPAQPKFNIGYEGNVSIFDTIIGVTSTFTEGTRLLNGSYYNFSFYHLAPIPPAYTILQDNDQLFSCAVAYDAGNYKTIGSLFDLGTMIDLDPSYTIELLISYLEFFDINVNANDVNEPVQPEKPSLWVYPNPAKNFIFVEGMRTTGEFSLIDLFGRKIRNFNIADISPVRVDITDLPPGIYIISFLDSKGQAGSAKFIRVID